VNNVSSGGVNKWSSVVLDEEEGGCAWIEGECKAISSLDGECELYKGMWIKRRVSV
jgi:hypothetical protein